MTVNSPTPAPRGFMARAPKSRLQTATRLGLALVFAWALGACAARPTSDAPVSAASRTLTPIAGSLEGFQSSVILTDPLRGSNAEERVAWAIDQARFAAAESSDADDALDIGAAPQALSPQRAAWYRVDEAINLASVAAAPSPVGDPVSVEAQRAAAAANVPPGYLYFYLPKGRERAQIQLYDEYGRMRLQGIIEASRILRDFRSGIVRSISPRLLAMIYLVGQHFDAEIEIISGYRVRGVNATSGSRHGSGEAIDFRISGVRLQTIIEYAESTFANLGMGIYPNSGFIHMDTRRPTFYWSDTSRSGQRSRTRARAITRRGDPSRDPTLRSVHLTEQELYTWPKRPRE